MHANEQWKKVEVKISKVSETIVFSLKFSVKKKIMGIFSNLILLISNWYYAYDTRTV